MFRKQFVDPVAQANLVFFNYLRRTFFDYCQFFGNQIGTFNEITIDITALGLTHSDKITDSLTQSLFQLRPNTLNVKKTFLCIDHIRAA